MSVRLHYKLDGRNVTRLATFDEEKALAIEMWEFVRHMMVAEDNVHNVEHWKKAFIDIKHECGVDIEWLDRCFLCQHCDDCHSCPLYDLAGEKPCGCDSGSPENDTPYEVVLHYSEHDIGEIDKAIDKIIHAVRSLE